VLLPAWDAQDVMFVCGGFGKAKNLSGVALIPRVRLQKALDDLMAGTNTQAIFVVDDQPAKNALTASSDMLLKSLDPHADGLSTWGSEIPYGWEPRAYALTQNSALVAIAAWSNDPTKAIPGKLIAINRADGTKLWDINLPGRVVYNGLAVTADGSVVVTMTDGQTICIRR